MLDLTFLNLMTRQHFEPALKNQIYDKFVLWNKLNEGGQIKTLTGTALQWNAVAQTHSAIGLLSGYDTMANQQVNPVKQASLSPAFYYGTVGLSQEEETKNSGNMEKLLDILTTQVDNCRTSMTLRMQTDAYGSGTLLDGKSPLVGLGAIVSASNTYAGIDRTVTANAFWKANVDSTAYTFNNEIDSTNTGYLPRVMRNSFISASHDAAPNLSITTKLIYNLYQDICGDKLRINNEMADAGFGGVEFQGGAVKMAFDVYAPAGYMYFLTLENFALWVYEGMNFNSDGWMKPVDQAAKLTHFFWMGQLQCDTPRQQAVISSIATS